MNQQKPKIKRKQLKRSSKSAAVILAALLLGDCRKKIFTEQIHDCDNAANYYEDGEHFIRRDMVTDDGVIDRKKMFDELYTGNVDCHPVQKKKFRLPVD